MKKERIQKQLDEVQSEIIPFAAKADRVRKILDKFRSKILGDCKETESELKSESTDPKKVEAEISREDYKSLVDQVSNLRQENEKLTRLLNASNEKANQIQAQTDLLIQKTTSEHKHTQDKLAASESTNVSLREQINSMIEARK